MGVAILGWRLAAAVGSLSGCLGVVSGTAIDTVLGPPAPGWTPGGDLREAMAGFPIEVVGRVLDRFYLPDGATAGAPSRRAGMHTRDGAPAAAGDLRPRRLRRVDLARGVMPNRSA